MSASSSDPDSGSGTADLLTPDEEGVLSALRDIVAGVRAQGLAPELEGAADRLVSAGAELSVGPGEPGPLDFRLRGVRFTLRTSPGPRRGIEVCFTPT
jgi:hypothetical protein